LKPLAWRYQRVRGQQQLFNGGAQLWVSRTGGIEKSSTLRNRYCDRLAEYGFLLHEQFSGECCDGLRCFTAIPNAPASNPTGNQGISPIVVPAITGRQ
jgi:hypothetical protein